MQMLICNDVKEGIVHVLPLHFLKYLFASFVKDALRFHFFITFCLFLSSFIKGQVNCLYHSFVYDKKDLYQIFGCISTFQTEKVFNELQQLDWCLIVI